MSTRTNTPFVTPTPITTPTQAKTGAKTSKRRNVDVQLTYLKDDPLYKTVKPLQVTPNFADTAHKTNVQLEPGQPETLHDVRDLGGKPLGDFTLDDHGFKYVNAPTAFKDWDSQPKIAQAYLPELEALLRREIDGCDEILFYDARIRQEGDEGLRVEGLSYNPFARQVHTDNTERSVLEKIHQMTEIKADYLLSGRARIINIWRPIKHPVYDCGLAIADGGKLREDDVLECERHLAKTGAYWDTMGVIRYRPGFSWYYCSSQAESEVLLFKNYDSATEVPARFCLHTAFDLPADTIPPNAPTRESIEVRALIFTYPPSGRRPSGVMQHPLALSLERNSLKRLDDEHPITDRLRTDIDEGHEVKDAVLLLRRNEIRRLEKQCEALTTKLEQAEAQREHAMTQHLRAAEQIQIQAVSIAALQHELFLYKPPRPTSRSRTEDSWRHHSSTSPSAEEGPETFRVAARRKSPPDVYREVELLHQTIERQEAEIQKWVREAMGRGSEAVSRSWQGSVDEAVRREREKDSCVIRGLREEIARLSGARSLGFR
ncbi:hypothetical protein LTR57_007618 [Friedmanniomyces endolithicus]|nr:hypothetical protein LTR94_001208 [Friedmanniomyces endolithicus]KAK0816540.1 hypothetical protein LTR59_000168 [Friedmanniomyces endolithicus]KAK0820936.1 hypothetical protein LTR75_001255 [Friedmanniomyces endolithicus]KAK0853387.1 hypothetical protein LTR03_002948 [Friedmanniomyces endolithicus]KAK0872649.1 hypothetical protein LTS02_001224 [Friedmanniomyces endolithicus]